MNRMKPENASADQRAGLCRYYLLHKRRYCKFEITSSDHDFCTFHAQTTDRVPCPLDPNHSVKREELEIHLTRCTSRTTQIRPEWYVENHNVPGDMTRATSPETSNLHVGNLTMVLELASLTERALEGTSIREDIQSHCVMHERLEAGIQSKHSQQQASLIGHLCKIGAMENTDLFIEWGAGRAELSYFLHQALPVRDRPPKLLLIDRDGGRLKRDGQIMKEYLHAGTDAASNVKRYKVDIAHVNLSRLIEVEFPTLREPVICSYSKHLCGAATDLTLNCLNAHNNARSAQMTLIIAVCCHQLCTWQSLGPGARRYLASKGVNRDSFIILRKMTSWHTSSSAPDSDRSKWIRHWSGLSVEARNDIGWRCKRLIDLARIADLHAGGWTAELLKYVATPVTTECYALLAARGCG